MILHNRQKFRCQSLFGLLAALAILLTDSAAFAQGLVWKVPSAGTWVRYDGVYEQTEERPKNTGEKQLPIGPWRRRIEIKALKTVQAEYRGQMIDCQWFEFVVATGREEAGNIATGPGSRRIYKVLVPLELVESSLGEPKDGLVLDAENIPIAYLPIVKGYRQIGTEAVEPLKTAAFSMYPTVSLVPNYRSLETIGQNEDPQVTLGGVTSATHYRGQLTIESLTNRSSSRSEIWYSPQAPFGVVRWQVEVNREVKAASATRDLFEQVSSYRVDMKAVSSGNDATSLLTEE